jgi:hypothetical protein
VDNATSRTTTTTPLRIEHRDPHLAKSAPSRSYSRFAVDSLPVIAHAGAAEKNPCTLQRHTPEEADACLRHYRLSRHPGTGMKIMPTQKCRKWADKRER